MSAARQRKRKSVSHTANLNPRQLTGSYIAKIALTSHCTTLMLFFTRLGMESSRNAAQICSRYMYLLIVAETKHLFAQTQTHFSIFICCAKRNN